MAPRSQTRIYEVKGQQETGRHTGVDAQGNPTLVEYTVTCSRRIDAYRSEFTQTGAGKASLAGTRVISKDGKTMTVTARGPTPRRSAWTS